MTAAFHRAAIVLRLFVAPWQVAAAVLILNVAFLAPHLYRSGAESFAQTGKIFVDRNVEPPSHRSKAISSLQATRDIGYDGQFSYYIELDPLKARYYIDAPTYRYARILYPVAAWAFAAGQSGALPYSMIAINLSAIVATVYLLGGYLVRHGASAWWAALYGLFPALIVCLWADLTEPLAFFFAAWGFVAFDRRPERALRYSVLFALAALTRETTLIIPGLIAIRIAFAGGSGLRLLA
jgi:hypothetical protein